MSWASKARIDSTFRNRMSSGDITLSSTHSIMIIDDNPGDILLVKEVLGSSKNSFKIDVAHDGVEALELLRSRTNSPIPNLPELIMIDLSLPKKSGFDVIKEIRAEQALRRIPIIVLSGLNSPEGVRTAYEAGANCYIVKPIGLEELERTFRVLDDFWFGVAKLPS